MRIQLSVSVPLLAALLGACAATPTTNEIAGTYRADKPKFIAALEAHLAEAPEASQQAIRALLAGVRKTRASILALSPDGTYLLEGGADGKNTTDAGSWEFADGRVWLTSSGDAPLTSFAYDDGSLRDPFHGPTAPGEDQPAWLHGFVLERVGP